VKVLIRHNIDNAVATNATVVKEWAEDHAGYYGAPHGAKRIDYRMHEIRYAGFIEGWKALTILLDVAVWATDGYAERSEGVACVHALQKDIVRAFQEAPESFGGWITCAKNLTLVGGPYEYREGRRHGLRQAQPCAQPPVGKAGTVDRWWYIESQRPDTNPDDMGLAPSRGGVGNESPHQA
jgi:hypothetical protein